MIVYFSTITAIHVASLLKYYLPLLATTPRRALGCYPRRALTLRSPFGSILYLGSDGYVDQNNQARKSLGKRKLEELLQSIYHLPLIEQKIALESQLDKHMKNTTQRDDIMVIGFKI